jgi:type II secretion system protein H
MNRVSLPIRYKTIQSHSARTGFTFVEMMIVVLITGILATIAAPRFSGVLQQARVKNAAKRINADLTLAQNFAKRTGTSKSVIFDPVNHSYTIPGLDTLNHSAGSYTVQLANYPFNVTLDSATFDPTPQTVTYNGYGIVISGGTIVIRSGTEQKVVTVSNGASLAAVLE